MNTHVMTAEVDPYGTGTVGARLRYEVAYAGSWLLMGLTLVKDRLVFAFSR